MKYKLGDIVIVLGDGLHGTPKYDDNGEYYFLNGNNIENGKQNPSFDILSAILHVLPLSLDSVINPNLSGAERECRELESIYLACPPEMRKTLLDATRSLAIHLTEFSNQNKNT